MHEPVVPSTCVVCSTAIRAGDDATRIGQVAIHRGCYPGRQQAPAAGRSHPVCPLCQIPLVSGDRVIYGRDALLHVECSDRAHAGDVIVAFLVAHADRPFCQACLATELALPLPRVRKALSALRAMAGFRVETRACAGCHVLQVTGTAVAGPACAARVEAS
jgi:hypothetical protein